MEKLNIFSVDILFLKHTSNFNKIILKTHSEKKK